MNDTITSLTPSYEVQRIWGNSVGDQYVSSHIDIDENLRYRVASSVVKDRKSGKTYIKLVNALPSQVTLKVQGIVIPDGASQEEYIGKVTDRKVSSVKGKSSGRIQSLPPYSVRIIEI